MARADSASASLALREKTADLLDTMIDKETKNGFRSIRGTSCQAKRVDP